MEEFLDLVKGGCNLNTPKAIWKKLQPYADPLVLHVQIEVLGVRNVPNSGGSFGVDVMYVK